MQDDSGVSIDLSKEGEDSQEFVQNPNGNSNKLVPRGYQI